MDTLFVCNGIIVFHTPIRIQAIEGKFMDTIWGRFKRILLIIYWNLYLPGGYNFRLGGGNIWSKRLELAYMVPFVMPHLTQIDVGDHDNLTMYFDVATLIPLVGKVWGGLFVDEFSFNKSGKLMKIPYNRYAWQLGWKSNLLSGIIPGTTSTLKYTRLMPFVYSHYPETEFNTFGSNRALDMTYNPR